MNIDPKLSYKVVASLANQIQGYPWHQRGFIIGTIRFAVALVLIASLDQIASQPLLAQTPAVSSLEAMVYQSEAVLVCYVDKLMLVPRQSDDLGHAVLTLNPIEVLKGEIVRGTQCVIVIHDNNEVEQLDKWIEDKKEFLFALRRNNETLTVENQQSFYRGSLRDSNSKPYSYWYDFKCKKSASMAEAIQDVKAFLEFEKVDPAQGMGSIRRPGHLQIRFPVNKRMDKFAQRAMRQELTQMEIKETSGVTDGPIQLSPVNSFDSSDRRNEIEWLAMSEVHNLANSDQNIELLKSLLVKTPIEFGEVDYRDDGDTITVFRRYRVRSEIQFALKKMGVNVELPPLDETVWTLPKHPDEVALLETLGQPEVYFNLDPFDPPKTFTRVKKLILRGSSLVSAPDLGGFEALEMLHFEHTKIADISKLSKVSTLKHLNIEWAPVTDLGPLAELTNLEELSLRGTRVVDLTPLSNLAKLELLDITHAPVDDLSPLKGLTNLKMLYAGPEKLDLQPLSELKYLQHWFGR